VRTRLAIVLIAGVVGSLAACSPTSTDPSCEVTTSGAASDAITATGAFGAKPTVEFEFPISLESTQRSVLIEGDGAVAAENTEVTLDFTILNGTTGDEIDATAYDGEAPAVFALDGTLIAGLGKTLQCSTEGSRVAGVITPEDGIAPEALEQFGLAEDDTLVFVADVISVAEVEVVDPPLSRADGEDQPLPEGFPAIEVTLAEDGTPSIVLPGGEPPAELQLAVLKKGEGPEVGVAADVIVHYYGVQWSDGERFDDSWSTGSPYPMNTSGVVAGFTAAIEGQTVGSQVLVVIPPALAYGEAGGEHPLAGETLVFVVDILGLG